MNVIPDSQQTEREVAPPATPTQPPDRRLQSLVDQVVFQEAQGEFLWRLPTMHLVSGLTVFGAAVTAGYQSPWFAGLWSVVALVSFLFMRSLLDQRTLADLRSTAALLASTTMLWWSLLLIAPLRGGAFPDLLLAGIVVALTSMPWSMRPNTTLFAGLATLFIFRLAQTDYPLLVVVGALVFLPLALRMSAMAHLSFLSRVTLVAVRRITDAHISTREILTLVAWHLAVMSGVRRALLITRSAQVTIVQDGVLEPSPVDPLFARGLLQRIQQFGTEEGILERRLLDVQYLPALQDWFQALPDRMVFVRCKGVLDEQEEEISIVVPLSRLAFLAGTQRWFQVISHVVAFLRLWLSSQRTRFVSSDALLHVQRVVSARERELDTVIHSVNNITQELAVLADRLEGRASTEGGVVDRVELLTRLMATSVSDVKIGWELARGAIRGRMDKIRLADVVPEIQEWMNYRRERRGLRGTDLFPTELRLVQVVRREFLMTALRALVGTAEHLVNESEFWFEVQPTPEGVRFVVCYRGPTPSVDVIEQAHRGIGDDEGTVARGLRAACRVAELSGGRFDVLRAERARRSELVLTLEVVPGEATDAPVAPSAKPLPVDTIPLRDISKGWALLVDDTSDVVAFYKKVAEVFSLDPGVAYSVTEAEVLINQRTTAPRVVVTDLQLGERTGIELVRLLRARYGDKLPIIVVSGEAGTDVADSVQQAGATMFLGKPISRQRLVQEIQRLLSA